jgi:hypothetical protein
MGGLGRAVLGAPHFLNPLPACPLFNLSSGFPGNVDSLQTILPARYLEPVFSFFPTKQTNGKVVPAVWVVGINSPPEKMSERSELFFQGEFIPTSQAANDQRSVLRGRKPILRQAPNN